MVWKELSPLPPSPPKVPVEVAAARKVVGEAATMVLMAPPPLVTVDVTETHEYDHPDDDDGQPDGQLPSVLHWPLLSQ